MEAGAEVDVGGKLLGVDPRPPVRQPRQRLQSVQIPPILHCVTENSHLKDSSLEVFYNDLTAPPR